jgi:plastocyanin
MRPVTFFPGGGPQTSLPDFNPGDPSEITQQGGHVYDSSQSFNSGIITTVPTGGDSGPLPPVPHYQTYTLTFPHAGTFTYYCLVHGIMMVGTVHVQPAGTRYPFTQRQYDIKAQLLSAALVVQGRALQVQGIKDGTNHNVFAGADNGAVMVMRFLRPTVVVHVGDTVTFDNNGMGAPHTVTFGEETPPPALFAPSGDPTSYTGGDLNSGIIPPGGTFDVTFTKAGTFHYICGLHDFMGMVGKVVVIR